MVESPAQRADRLRELGARIRRARFERGERARPRFECTQEWLAEQIGVSAGAVSHWEAGKKEPDGGKQRAIADVLWVRRAWLILDEGPMLEEEAPPSRQLRVAEPSPGDPDDAEESGEPSVRRYQPSTPKPAADRKRKPRGA